MKKILFCCIYALAGNAMANPVCPSAIKIAFYDYGLLYEQGKGIDQEVINELKLRTNCNFVSSVLPRARIWKDIESGDVAMSVSGIQNASRDQFAWFAHYISIKNISIIPKRLTKTIQTFEQFINDKSLQWGAVRGFKHGETQDQFLMQLREQNRVIEAASVEQLFQLLKAGRIQGIFSQSPVYGYYLPKLGMSHDISIQDWAPQETAVPHGLILSKKHFSAAEAEQWKNLINTMNHDGTMLRILKQYLPSNDIQRSVYTAP